MPKHSKLNLKHYQSVLFRLLHDQGHEVTIRTHEGQTCYVARAPFGTVAVTVDVPESEWPEFPHSPDPVPEDAFDSDLAERLTDYVRFGDQRPPEQTSVRFGHHFSEVEFRQSDERVRWWRSVLQHPWGQDLLAVLTELDPSVRLGDQVAAGHRSDLVQTHATRGDENRLLGKIEMFAAVWRTLTRKLVTPIQTRNSRGPRRGSTPVARPASIDLPTP